MRKLNHQTRLKRIFTSLDVETMKVSSREGQTIEFKLSFNWANKDKYAKSMAGFANNGGGYIVFGISDSPRRLVGLSGSAFEAIDEATITAYLNGLFSPELRYEKCSTMVHGMKIGAIFVDAQDEPPVIAIKNDGDVKEGEVYYRYNARTEKIKYPELKALFDRTRDRERKKWMDLFERVSRIGPEHAAVFDMSRAVPHEGQLLIDERTLSKARFVKEGSFSEKGKPVLRVVGSVTPVNLATGEGNTSRVRITDDPSAPPVREETVLAQFPLSYRDLIGSLRERYTNFKQDRRFHKVLRSLKKKSEFCHVRYLDPKRKKGAKEFYPLAILSEFDKHYARGTGAKQTPTAA